MNPTPQAQLQYVDRPEISETYADSIEHVTLDATGTVKMEFVVYRLNPDPSKPLTGKKYTSSRLVMPLGSVIGMFARLKDLLANLEQQGIITLPAPSTSTKN